MASETTTMYDTMRSYAPAHMVFSQAMADANKFLTLFSQFEPKSLSHFSDDEIGGIAHTAKLYLIMINKSGTPRYDHVVTEMRELYQNGVARDITGAILQDLHEGMLNLETLAERATRKVA